MVLRSAARRDLVLSLLLAAGLAAPQATSGVAALPGQGRDAGAGTRSTTLAALTAYPLVFHTHRVRVLGEATIESATGTVWLSDATRRVAVVGADEVRARAGSRVLISGSFIDLGRLQPDDARLERHDFRALSRAVLNRDWPGPGELLVVVADAVAPAEHPTAPSLRSVALDPAGYEGTRVTLTGRFRGANLYGDLPAGPGKSKWDFVLLSADAAVWITALRPRGRGFDLDVHARVDTGRWVRVTGVVRHEGALVWIEGQTIRLADAEEEKADEPVPAQVSVPPRPPAVIFSAPVQDDTDVAAKTDVRIQFSRDMDAGSFKDRVRIAYFGGAPDPPSPPAFTWTYRQGTRVLEIRFQTPLERFRTVRVELLEDITASDGTPLKPWTLTFTIGAM